MNPAGDRTSPPVDRLTRLGGSAAIGAWARSRTWLVGASGGSGRVTSTLRREEGDEQTQRRKESIVDEPEHRAEQGTYSRIDA